MTLEGLSPCNTREYPTTGGGRPPTPVHRDGGRRAQGLLFLSGSPSPGPSSPSQAPGLDVALGYFFIFLALITNTM